MGFFIEPESEKKAKAKQEKKGKSSKKRYVEEKKAEKKKQISEKKVKKPETTPIDDDAPEIVKSSEAIKSKNMNFSQKIVEVVGGKNLGSKEATFKPRDPRFDPFVHGETLSTTQFAKYYKHAIEHQESQYQQEKKNFDQNKNTMNPHEKQRTELRIQVQTIIFCFFFHRIILKNLKNLDFLQIYRNWQQELKKETKN